MSKSIGPGHEVLLAFLAASNTMSRKSDAFFSRFKITPAQFNVLNLAMTHGGTIAQKELVSGLLVGKASVSIVLRRMLRDGLLTQKPDPADLRKSVITLTSKGKKQWKRTAPEYGKAVERIFGEYNAKELKEFQKLLVKLDQSLGKTIKE
ncbi:MAG: MarR family transcriptional regulator [Methylacidiphilales bacterium]|nr:MarR family transcriptional regulator [Candidatus Methylacidiphilales bacterium]